MVGVLRVVITVIYREMTHRPVMAREKYVLKATSQNKYIG